MLVNRLIGPYAGTVVDMNFDDARRAEANGTAKRLTADEAAAHGLTADEDDESLPEQPVPLVKSPVAKNVRLPSRGRGRRPDYQTRS